MLVSQPAAVTNPWEIPVFFMCTPLYIKETPVSNTLEWTLPSPTPYHAYHMMPVQS